MSSTVVVVNAELVDLVVPRANKKRGEERRNPKRVTFSAWPNFLHSLHCARDNDVYYMFQQFTKDNKSMIRKSTHLQVIPQKSTQNAGNLPFQTCKKNQWTFFVV